MKPFEIFVAYVSWGTGGKKRPVLVLSISNKNVIAFKITTKYDNKSVYIRSRYFAIINWKEAGLENPSYIDTNNKVKIPLNNVDVENRVGKLSKRDKKNLIKFLSE
jgi:hypothetical protein